jgi:hypothetical protein
MNGAVFAVSNEAGGVKLASIGPFELGARSRRPQQSTGG